MSKFKGCGGDCRQGHKPCDCDWRTSTLGERVGHRHEHSGWVGYDSWKPSDSYVPEPVRDGWTFAQLFCAVAVLCTAGVVIAVEVAKWVK
jgi:hypothetical protein